MYTKRTHATLCSNIFAYLLTIQVCTNSLWAAFECMHLYIFIYIFYIAYYFLAYYNSGPFVTQGKIYCNQSVAIILIIQEANPLQANDFLKTPFAIK